LGGEMAKVGGLYVYGPSAISGNTDPKASVGVGLLGDSILWGGRESGGLGYGTQGFGVRAIIDSFGYIQASCSGASARRWAVSNKLINRHVLLASADVAIVALGTNDLLSSRSTAKIQADLLTIWTRLAARGIKVFACTIPPLTTSPDGWTSLNQTPSAFEATRLAVNAWLRTNPGPLSGIFDTAAKVTTLNGSGQEIWVPNTCVDGTHPSIQGHAAMATAIDTRFFVLGP
ncbi:SGNH/GDSL hydrolase family protein, partial [bacterium]